MLVLPHCAATNRVPDERVRDQPVCAKCGTALADTKPVDVSDAVLPKYLRATEAPVLVDFWAAWCGPCRQMAPHFAAAAQQLPDVRFAKVDSDAAQQASAGLRHPQHPDADPVQGGREVARRSGAASAGDIAAWTQSQLARCRRVTRPRGGSASTRVVGGDGHRRQRTGLERAGLLAQRRDGLDLDPRVQPAAQRAGRWWPWSA